ncbi:MAG: OmpA family protein [Bacteroidetes bacterium]|nr:OmpA family protein [Bacteroidota bacterium]
MKKISLYTLLVFSLLLIFISAGIPKAAREKIVRGDEYFVNDDYDKALPLYLEAYKIDPTNSNLSFKIGVCCLNIPSEKSKAENYLFAAASNVSEQYKEGSIKERRAPVTTYYYFAEALHLNGKFDDALANFEKCRGYMNTADSNAVRDLDLREAWCRNGKTLEASPVNFKVENLGANINSPYPDYSPVISADERTLIFTTRRPENTGGLKDDRDGMYFEDIYISTKNDDGTWGKAIPVGNNINTPGHDASVGISADGQQIFIYKDDAGDGNIYTSNLVGSNWMQPQKLNDNVNSKSWEPSASVTPDGTVLYFTSDRAGGFGGRDIWKSLRLPNGEWGKPINCGPTINSRYDEDAPEILADGQTLYFASNGPASMGGFDIFSSVMVQDSGWRKPVNIGYPVNTTDDDLFFFPTPDDKHAFYSSANNANGMGEKDIYFLTFPEKQESKLTVLQGMITSIYGGVPENTQITVTDVETGDIMGIYTPNSLTGRYVIILPSGKNYSITYEATDYLYQSDNMNIGDSSSFEVIDRPVELEPLKVGQKLVVRNIFFDSGKSQLKADSKSELDKLVDLMLKHPMIIVEISGHTDASGSDELNQKLSEQRAQSVADYLAAKGVDKSRLRTKGYGESKPIAINYNKDGSANKNGMALNRRFEFTILSVDGKYQDVVEPINVPDKLKNKGQ